MSKYFDETMKLNSLTAPLGSTPRGAAQQLTAERFSGEMASSRGFDLGLRKDQRTSIPLSRALRQEFIQCDDLETFQESFRVLRTRLLRLQAKHGLRSVVVTSSTKGEGKSTVSLNLAFTCAQLPEMKVLLIDADIRGCGLSQLLNPPKGQGLLEVLLQKSELDEAILATDLPNLYFLPCESTTSIPPAELLASRRWSELIASCAETFSLVIVDAPPILNLTDADLLSAPCDGVLMVARSHETRTDFVQKATSQIDLRKLIGVILNGTAVGPDAYTYGYKRIPESSSRPIPVVSRLFGRSDSDKNETGTSAVPPTQPATPSLPCDAARPTAPSQAASPQAASND